MNVSILIIQILFYLQKDMYDNITDRVNPLSQYAARHLRSEDTFRSRQFIKMLAVMEEQGFDYESTKRKSQKYFDKLRTVEMKHDEENFENLEIIPYEHLWIHILNQLRKKEVAAAKSA